MRMGRTRILGALLILAGTWASGRADAQTTGSASSTEANNPTAPLVQFQVQDWYSPKLSGVPGDENLVLLRPVLPFEPMGPLAASIVRPALPVITTPNGRTALGDLSALDIFFVVDQPTLRFGIGPSVVLPTATYRPAGQGLWQLGPAAALVYSGQKGLVLGLLALNPISFAGPNSRASASALSVQPIAVKSLADGWFLRFDPIIGFNWKDHGDATVPLNLGVGRVFRIGQQMIDAYIQPEWTVARPNNAPATPRFTVRFAFHLLYPSRA
jgi:hypothetical protein